MVSVKSSKSCLSVASKRGECSIASRIERPSVVQRTCGGIRHSRHSRTSPNLGQSYLWRSSFQPRYRCITQNKDLFRQNPRNRVRLRLYGDRSCAGRLGILEGLLVQEVIARERVEDFVWLGRSCLWMNVVLYNSLRLAANCKSVLEGVRISGTCWRAVVIGRVE